MTFGGTTTDEANSHASVLVQDIQLLEMCSSWFFCFSWYTQLA